MKERDKDKPAFELVTRARVTPEDADRFLRGYFPARKCEFLARHGAWRYRGVEHEVFALAEGEIAAYCAYIPAEIRLAGKRRAAIWWVDLYVDPRYRGIGIQAAMDRLITARCDIKLGFPNELAAKIHRKHGWGVREDLRFLILPMRPLAHPRVKNARGARRVLLTAIALALAPVAALPRWRWRRYRPRWARVHDDPPLATLAAIFRDGHRDEPTTWRDEAYFRWRYLEAPHASSFVCLTGGSGGRERLALIARRVRHGDRVMTRILDVFGDVTDRKGLRDMLKTLLREESAVGSIEVRALVSTPALFQGLRATCPWLRLIGRFCWLCREAVDQKALDAGHWVLADSDHDEP